MSDSPPIQPAVAPAAPLPSKARPATVEDAPDSDDDARSEKTVDEPGTEDKAAEDGDEAEDAVSKAIREAEASVEPKHDWQAVWSPAQNGASLISSD